MISSFSAQPKAQNNNAKIIMWVFFAIAAVAAVLYVLLGVYRGVVGAVTVASITTAILMYTKYVSVKFFYDIIAEEGETPLFVVRQRVGKRDTTLCRVELADIISITKETSAERKAHKREKTTPLYVYAPTIAPPISYRMTVRNSYERSEIVLEGSDEFFNMLSACAVEARTLRHEEDDE